MAFLLFVHKAMGVQKGRVTLPSRPVSPGSLTLTPCSAPGGWSQRRLDNKGIHRFWGRATSTHSVQGSPVILKYLPLHLHVETPLEFREHFKAFLFC